MMIQFLSALSCEKQIEPQTVKKKAKLTEMGLDVPLAFAVLVWTVCGVIFSFLAREACRPFTFGRALSVSFWQCLFTVLVAALWQRSLNKQQQHHQQNPPPSHSWAKLAGIAALNLIGLVSTNLSIGMGDVAFAAVIKATEPCFLFVLKLFLGHEFEDRGVLFIVAAVLGTGLMSWDNSFSLSALFLGLTANCCYSSVNYFLSTERANVARHLVVFFGLAAPCVLIAQFFVGSNLFDAPTVTYAVSAGVVFGVYRVVSGWVVTRIDVILHALLNLAKRAAVIVVFAFAYNRHLSLASWTGAFVTFFECHVFFSPCCWDGCVLAKRIGIRADSRVFDGSSNICTPRTSCCGQGPCCKPFFEAGDSCFSSHAWAGRGASLQGMRNVHF
jgi:hypothetical protein